MLRLRRPTRTAARRARPSLPVALLALERAALARADDGLLLDRPTAAADPSRLAVLADCGARTLELALDHAAREAAHRALSHGWRVDELLGFARGRLDENGRTYLADVLVLAAQWSAAADWLTQLDALGVTAWWTSGAALSTQWIDRHDVDRSTLLEIAVDVLALLSHLPHTATPRPDSPAPSGARAGVLVTERRIVTKIDALFARAVGTTFTDEAEACAAKAQELLLRYARPGFGTTRRAASATPHTTRRPAPAAPLAIPA